MCCAVWQWYAVMCGATAELIPTPVYLVPCCSKVSVVDDAAGYSKEIEVWVPLLPPCQGFTHAWLHPCLQVGLQSHHVQIVSCHDNLTMRRPVWGTIMKMMHAHTHAHTHTHTHTLARLVGLPTPGDVCPLLLPALHNVPQYLHQTLLHAGSHLRCHTCDDHVMVM